MAKPTYATDADLRRRAGISATPSATRDICDVLDTASRLAEQRAGGRLFYPQLETRGIDWPNRANTNTHVERLRLGADELVSINTITVNNEAWTEGTHYRLLRTNPDGPYTMIEVTETGDMGFRTGDEGYQAPIQITGQFGFTADTTNITTLAAAVATTTETTITVASCARTGIGAALLINTEWLIVTDTAFTDAADTLAANMDLDTADTTLTVSDSSVYATGETLIVDNERLAVLDIPSATTISVLRAQDGTEPASHTSGAQIRALRLLTVERAQLGTAGAAHSSGDTVARLAPPGIVRDFTMAHAMNELRQIAAGYAREIGSGETAREVTGRGLAKVDTDLRNLVGRKHQFRATGGGR